MKNLLETFGQIDIYLFDQLLKGRIQPGMCVLDAGCGSGRNIHYLLQQEFDVHGIDQSAAAIETVRTLAKQLGYVDAESRFQLQDVCKMSFADRSFDIVISSAVLHFARDEQHFKAMMDEMWRVLKPSGMFFARLASSIGIETLIENHGDRRFGLPDGSERFLVDEAMLRAKTQQLGGTFLEPIKTVNVENKRCMTTWCLRKNSSIHKDH